MHEVEGTLVVVVLTLQSLEATAIKNKIATIVETEQRGVEEPSIWVEEKKKEKCKPKQKGIINSCQWKMNLEWMCSL